MRVLNRTSPAWWWSASAERQLESMTRKTGMKAKKTSESLLQVIALSKFKVDGEA